MAWSSGHKAHGLGIMSSSRAPRKTATLLYRIICLLDGLLVKATPAQPLTPCYPLIMILIIVIGIVIVIVIIIKIIVIISPYNPYSIPWIHEDS